MVHNLKREQIYSEQEQKLFLANVENAINSPIDLPSQISRYQDTLKYARSKVYYVYGIGLYMSPSNMELRIGTIQDYNNKNVVATDKQFLGLNNNVNLTPIPQKQSDKVKGTPTKQVQKPVEIPTPKVSERDYNIIKNYAKARRLSQDFINKSATVPDYFNSHANGNRGFLLGNMEPPHITVLKTP